MNTRRYRPQQMRRLFVALTTLICGLLAIASTACGASPKDIKPDGNMERSAVPDAFKWKLEALFADDAAFAQALGQARDEVAKVAAFEGKLAEPSALESCLDRYFATRLMINKLTMYASMRFDSHQKSTELQAQKDQALKLMSDFMAATGFIRREVLALDDAATTAAYQSHPGLETFRSYIDGLRRRRARVLDESAERVLALAGDNLWAEIDLNEIPSDFEKAFDAMRADMVLPTIKDEKGESVQLTLSNYGRYRSSADRRVRRDTVEGFFATLRQYEHIFAAAFAGQLNLNVMFARARGYDTVLEAYLDKDEIDTAVYYNLIETINANLEPLHQYLELRKKVMGLDELHIYDLYAPMVPTVEVAIPYAEAAEILPKALEPLGEKYGEVLRHGLDPSSGWIDLYPHKDKQSGAFSSSVFGVHPYVKMNYFAQLDDLSTLAHEYGHALHSHLSMTHQPYQTFNYVSFIAETASTINEKFLSDYLFEHAKSDAERLYVLTNLVETIRTTIYRQALFAEFELAVHTAAEKGTPITAEFLNTTYKNLLTTYYGAGLTIGENDNVEWAYVPHFYYKYYMFSYATGLSGGIALADHIQAGGQPARDAYLGMLQSGSSKPPLTLLKDAGVDLTRPASIEAGARLLSKTILQIEEILAR